MLSDDEKHALASLRVVIVEDEFHVLLLIEDMLNSLGCTIAGTATDLQSAIDAANSCEADFAVLDVNLCGEKSYPAAQLFTARGVRIVFSTGYGLAGIDSAWRSFPVIEKPYTALQLATALLKH